MIWLAAVLSVALLDFWVRCAFRKKNSRRRRALWLQRHSRRILRIFRLKPQVSGQIPSRGLLFSNHLGYLDVMVLASAVPVILLSKVEVKSWPVFGMFAQFAGTLFVDRERRTHVGQVNNEIQSALDDGMLVGLFPEGTSSNGKGILPFRSALLQPAVGLKYPVSVSYLEYSIDDGDAGNEVCYWGDHTFFPHMLNMISKRKIRAIIRFAPVPAPAADRKALAVQLREEVLKLKNHS